ncbi:MAG: RluA family pseudouridine synthase [Victivallales bacterium]|nr:RluA family pseudouridine synthase [Victivallales bacterium]
MAVKRTSKIRIGEGKPLGILDYLSGRFTYHDATSWAEEIATGRIIVNGVTATAAMVLCCGDEMEYFPEARPEPEVDETVTVVHEDYDFLALCKSGNLPCHPAGIFFNRTLWAKLKEGRVNGIAPLEEIHFVTRLDRETSGLVLVAKNKRAAKTAARATAREEACKEYWVVVEGDFPDELSANGWLWQDERSIVKKKRCFGLEKPDGAIDAETSATSFRCLRRGNGMSWLLATLGTGRTHQIRATLCSLGYPVVGDKLYGVDDGMYLRFVKDALTEEDRRRLRIDRQALHACLLRLPLPEGRLLDLRTDWEDFEKLLDCRI